MAKQSILSLSSGRYYYNLEILEQINKCRTLDELASTYKRNLGTEEDLMNLYQTPRPFKYTPLEYATKLFLVDSSVDNT